MNDDATQFSYFRDNELTQLAGTTIDDKNDDSTKALDKGTIFLNKYKILEVLGEGSFSLIYLLEAIDASKKLLVAKEFFPKGFVTRNQNNEVILKTSLTEKEIENYHFMKDIFIGEAQNLVKVSKRTHPNVLNFFALEENINNTMYLITDYEEGMTLKQYVKERKKEHKGKLTNQEITGIATGLLNGLTHIHKVDVYHQDIKLENILIRQDQYPLLLDFGASIILYDEKQKKYFNATTPRYAAPEQVNLAQPPKIDQRTDIYELGVLLYKLITDEFPPKASERLQAEEENKDSYIPLEVQKPYGYDTNVLKAVDRALDLEPENRFQNAEDFKKALLHQKSYANFILTGLILLIPLFLGLMYTFWPESKGTAKLNLEQKKYFVYSDGKKITLSEEKTVLLSEGKHQLTIIKDGYIPHEVNVTIKAHSIVNVSGRLAPLSHIITLGSNVSSAAFMVNGRSLRGNIFEGKAGNTYSITTSSPNYTTVSTEIDYIQLHQNDFEYYQELQPAQIKVKIKVKTPIELGKNTIKVNEKIINGNILVAQYDTEYTIDIVNPYYKKVHFKRSYNELNKNPEQIISLEQGQGEIILRGLPEGVTLSIYKKYLDKTKQVNSQFNYSNKEYKSKILAFDKVYIKLSKEGYETLNTPVFSIQHNSKYMKTYTLKRKKLAKKINKVVKKEEVKKEEVILATKTSHLLDIKEVTHEGKIDKVSKSNMILKVNDVIVNKNVPIKVVNKTKVDKRKESSNHLSLKQKNKNIETIKYKIKKGDTLFSIARAYHTTIEKIKIQNNFQSGLVLTLGKILEVPVDRYFQNKDEKVKPKKVKPKKVKPKKVKPKKVKPKKVKPKKVKPKRSKKYKKKKITSKYLWYCVAGSDGTHLWSAKRSTKKSAYSSALKKCRRSRQSFCRVSSCYIVGGS